MIKKYGKKLVLFCSLAIFSFSMIFFEGGKASSFLPRENEKSFYTFLVCGLDKTSKNTDVMMLASLCEESGALNILQIPRDTFVRGESLGLRATRINALYAALLGQKNDKKAAMEALCALLSRALCVEIDRYVLMDTSAFAKIIDSVGGVEYFVPSDMDYEDPYQGLYIHLKKGLQTLDGKKAEAFIRYRAGYATGDIGRVEARGGFMSAAFSQIRKKLSVKGALAAAAELISAVTTDISAGEAAHFASRLYGLEEGSVNIKTICGSSVQNPKTGAWIYYALNKRGAFADVSAYLLPKGSFSAYSEFDRYAIFTDNPNGENPYISKYYYSEIQIE